MKEVQRQKGSQDTQGMWVYTNQCVPVVSNQVHTSDLQWLWTIQGFNSRLCTKHEQDKACSLTLWSFSHWLFPKPPCKLDNLFDYKGSPSTCKKALNFKCQKHSEDVSVIRLYSKEKPIRISEKYRGYLGEDLAEIQVSGANKKTFLVC